VTELRTLGVWVTAVQRKSYCAGTSDSDREAADCQILPQGVEVGKGGSPQVISASLAPPMILHASYVAAGRSYGEHLEAYLHPARWPSTRPTG